MDWTIRPKLPCTGVEDHQRMKAQACSSRSGVERKITVDSAQPQVVRSMVPSSCRVPGIRAMAQEPSSSGAAFLIRL